MSNSSEDLSKKIMMALKDILPKGTGFIMICGDIGDENIGITANIPDGIALEFLRAATDSILTEPAVSLEDDQKEVN